MGVTGVDGVFRHSMETTTKILRDNKSTLISVIEPFLRDPTVAWGRQGRAQRNSNTAAPNVPYKDADNVEAIRALSTVGDRLSGVYNITHPLSDKIRRDCAKRKHAYPPRGVGALPEEVLPLSVDGQVQRLIEEATSEFNLAQMYIGWQPWN